MNKILHSVVNGFKVVVQEFMNFGVGWIIGVYVMKFVASYFEVSALSNLYGFWSNKTIVDAETLPRLEFVLSLTLGYLVMKTVNKFIHPIVEKAFAKVDDQLD